MYWTCSWDWEEMECAQNFGGENSLEMDACKTGKEVSCEHNIKICPGHAIKSMELLSSVCFRGVEYSGSSITVLLGRKARKLNFTAKNENEFGL
jgi:hypothetical protein